MSAAHDRADLQRELQDYCDYNAEEDFPLPSVGESAGSGSAALQHRNIGLGIMEGADAIWARRLKFQPISSMLTSLLTNSGDLRQLAVSYANALPLPLREMMAWDPTAATTHSTATGAAAPSSTSGAGSGASSGLRGNASGTRYGFGGAVGGAAAAATGGGLLKEAAASVTPSRALSREDTGRRAALPQGQHGKGQGKEELEGKGEGEEQGEEKGVVKQLDIETPQGGLKAKRLGLEPDDEALPPSSRAAPITAARTTDDACSTGADTANTSAGASDGGSGCRGGSGGGGAAPTSASRGDTSKSAAHRIAQPQSTTVATVSFKEQEMDPSNESKSSPRASDVGSTADIAEGRSRVHTRREGAAGTVSQHTGRGRHMGSHPHTNTRSFSFSFGHQHPPHPSHQLGQFGFVPHFLYHRCTLPTWGSLSSLPVHAGCQAQAHHHAAARSATGTASSEAVAAGSVGDHAPSAMPLVTMLTARKSSKSAFMRDDIVKLKSVALKTGSDPAAPSDSTGSGGPGGVGSGVSSRLREVLEELPILQRERGDSLCGSLGSFLGDPQELYDEMNQHHHVSHHLSQQQQQQSGGSGGFVGAADGGSFGVGSYRTMSKWMASSSLDDDHGPGSLTNSTGYNLMSHFMGSGGGRGGAGGSTSGVNTARTSTITVHPAHTSTHGPTVESSNYQLGNAPECGGGGGTAGTAGNINSFSAINRTTNGSFHTIAPNGPKWGYGHHQHQLSSFVAASVGASLGASMDCLTERDRILAELPKVAAEAAAALRACAQQEALASRSESDDGSEGGKPHNQTTAGTGACAGLSVSQGSQQGWSAAEMNGHSGTQQSDPGAGGGGNTELEALRRMMRSHDEHVFRNPSRILAIQQQYAVGPVDSTNSLSSSVARNEQSTSSLAVAGTGISAAGLQLDPAAGSGRGQATGQPGNSGCIVSAAHPVPTMAATPRAHAVGDSAATAATAATVNGADLTSQGPPQGIQKPAEKISSFTTPTRSSKSTESNRGDVETSISSKSSVSVAAPSGQQSGAKKATGGYSSASSSSMAKKLLRSSNTRMPVSSAAPTAVGNPHTGTRADSGAPAAGGMHAYGGYTTDRAISQQAAAATAAARGHHQPFDRHAATTRGGSGAAGGTERGERKGRGQMSALLGDVSAGFQRLNDTFSVGGGVDKERGAGASHAAQTSATAAALHAVSTPKRFQRLTSKSFPSKKQAILSHSKHNTSTSMLAAAVAGANGGIGDDSGGGNSSGGGGVGSHRLAPSAAKVRTGHGGQQFAIYHGKIVPIMAPANSEELRRSEQISEYLKQYSKMHCMNPFKTKEGVNDITANRRRWVHVFPHGAQLLFTFTIVITITIYQCFLNRLDYLMARLMIVACLCRQAQVCGLRVELEEFD